MCVSFDLPEVREMENSGDMRRASGASGERSNPPVAKKSSDFLGADALCAESKKKT